MKKYSLMKPFILAAAWLCLASAGTAQEPEAQSKLHVEAELRRDSAALTKLEFLLLRELAEHFGQPLRKEELLASIWGLDFDPGSNVVDVCVRRLRSKLGFDLIKMVRGAGYQLTS